MGMVLRWLDADGRTVRLDWQLVHPGEAGSVQFVSGQAPEPAVQALVGTSGFIDATRRVTEVSMQAVPDAAAG